MQNRGNCRAIQLAPLPKTSKGWLVEKSQGCRRTDMDRETQKNSLLTQSPRSQPADHMRLVPLPCTGPSSSPSRYCLCATLSLVCLQLERTHTHTHTYIYIYIIKVRSCLLSSKLRTKVLLWVCLLYWPWKIQCNLSNTKSQYSALSMCQSLLWASRVIHKTSSCNRRAYHCHPHFTEEAREAQRGEAICSRSHR